MTEIEDLTRAVIAFRDERNWAQFHRPKDVVLALLVEAGELAEHFKWRTGEALEEHLAKSRVELGEELADVLYWVLLLAHDLKIELGTAFAKKMEQNRVKYPLEKAKDSCAKYTEL